MSQLHHAISAVLCGWVRERWVYFFINAAYLTPRRCGPMLGCRQKKKCPTAEGGNRHTSRGACALHVVPSPSRILPAAQHSRAVEAEMAETPIQVHSSGLIRPKKKSRHLESNQRHQDYRSSNRSRYSLTLYQLSYSEMQTWYKKRNIDCKDGLHSVQCVWIML